MTVTTTYKATTKMFEVVVMVVLWTPKILLNYVLMVGVLYIYVLCRDYVKVKFLMIQYTGAARPQVIDRTMFFLEMLFSLIIYLVKENP